MKRSQSGFTLLELLISLSIVGALSLICLSGLQVASRAWEAGEREALRQQRLRILCDRLVKEVKSAYEYKIRKENKISLAFQGTSESLTLISAADALANPFRSTGLKVLQLYIDEDAGTPEQGLVIKEGFITFDEEFLEEPPEGVVYEVIPEITTLSLRYFTYIKSGRLELSDEELENGEWVDKWGGTEEELYFESQGSEAAGDIENYIQKYSQLHLPIAMEITFSYYDPGGSGKEIQFPPLYITFPEASSMSTQRN